MIIVFFYIIIRNFIIYSYNQPIQRLIKTNIHNSTKLLHFYYIFISFPVIYLNISNSF